MHGKRWFCRCKSWRQRHEWGAKRQSVVCGATVVQVRRMAWLDGRRMCLVRFPPRGAAIASPAYGVYGAWMRQVVPLLAFPSLAWLCNSPESQSMYRARTYLVPYGMARIWFSSIGANRRLPVGYVYVKSRTPIRMVPIVVPAAAVTGSNDRWAWSAFVAGGAQG